MDGFMEGWSVGIISLCPQRVTFLDHDPASSHRDTNAKEIISNNFLFFDTKNSSTLITFRCLFLMDIYNLVP